MSRVTRTVSSPALIGFGLLGWGNAEAHATFRAPPPYFGETATALLISLAALGYAAGFREIWRRGGEGRGRNCLRAGSFACALGTLSVALLSPLDRWGSELFSLHMIQHELLILVAAPLLVAGRPLPVYLWAFKASTRASIVRLGHPPVMRALWNGLRSPPIAWTLHALTLWLWHIPALFDAVLRNAALHDLQHFTFLGAALCFWAALFEARKPEHQGAAVVYLFTTTVHTSVLGALITFATHPWYAAYLQIPHTSGLTALEDQELGGLVMWVPGSMVYIGVALLLLARWLRSSERSVVGRANTGQ